jgi:putative aldouronate transport system substrate-binding protein
MRNKEESHMPGKRMPIRYILPVITLILALFPASCQGSAPAEGINAPAADKRYPDVLQITRCLFFGDDSDNQNLKEEFQRIFKEKTGINLKVIYPPRNNYMEKVNMMIASGELDGLVNFFSPSNIKQAIVEDTIVPLDEYLESNEHWNSMPEEYRNAYKIDGKVYAIPAGYDGAFFTRSFRKDWLDNLGLKVPETANELLETARAFTEDDPDRNGENDTYGLTSSKFWNLQDIFQAFGARLNNTGDSPIAWDPATGLWQDSMLKPGMADALAYINRLYAMGYLDPDFMTNDGNRMREKMLTGNAGSTFYWVTHSYRFSTTKKANPEAQWVEIPALKGSRTSLLNARVMGGLIYVLVKGTPQPQETVNAFLDILFDEDMFFMFRYGIEGVTYRQDGRTILILTDPNTKQPYETAGLTNEMPQFGRFEYPWCYDGTPEEIRFSLGLIDTEHELLKEAEASGLIFDVSDPAYDSPLSRAYSKTSADAQKIFENEACMAIFGVKPIEQALADYRKKMREIGADRILEEANEAIGKTADQKY